MKARVNQNNENEGKKNQAYESKWGTNREMDDEERGREEGE